MIRSVSVGYTMDDRGKVGFWGTLWVHRTNTPLSVASYSLKNLARYQRAVRLLNAFVERNMK